MATRPVAPREIPQGEVLVWDVWMYHPIEGAKTFKNYEIHTLEGWFDDPAKATAALDRATKPSAEFDALYDAAEKEDAADEQSTHEKRGPGRPRKA